MQEMIYKGEYCSKPRMTKSDKWKKRKCVTDYWAFKDAINIQANQQGFKIGDEIGIIFYIQVPKSNSAKKNAKLVGTRHQVKPDKDNLEKGVMDALKDKDQTIWCGIQAKIWAYEPSIFIRNLGVDEHSIVFKIKGR